MLQISTEAGIFLLQKKLWTFRLFNDGLAFRYLIPNGSGAVTSDHTSYTIPDGTGRWIQTYHQDGYEDFYPYVTDGHAQGRWRPGNKWGYPALIESCEGTFALITEAGIQRDHCGSYLDNKADSCRYNVVLADSILKYDNGWESPWRVIIAGGLDTVVESTLVSDVSEPCAIEDTSWIKPGLAAWIYWANNHGSSDYRIVCEYIDLAAAMGWPYDLIDAEWDNMGNGGDITDALRYAASKGVKPMIWYNSSTNWINGAPTPYYRLNKKEDRQKEYAWLKEQGKTAMRGPLNPSTNHTCGVLVDSFDSMPCIMMPYNPPYYDEIIKSAGLEKAKDLLAFDRTDKNDFSPRMQKIIQRILRNPEITMRSINMNDFDNEVKTVREIYNAAWSQNYGFVPMTVRFTAISVVSGAVSFSGTRTTRL